ncbi:MAG: molybdate ABC transporter substrate-binding protein [Woeseiaceae bacterium]|nr:molybdate ABC transporter substrate-binding protein [Woeseiaceae bacterium]
MRTRRFLTLVTILLPALAGAGEPLTVAVASNFRATAQELAGRYETETGTELRLSSGSTGALYARINNGAPYDVFLAADAERPSLLAESGLGLAATRRTYAIGALVVWSRDPKLAGGDCREALDAAKNARIAIANPETAPYGKAAIQFLENAGILTATRPSLALGENVSQALQFAATGNARFGIVAAPLLRSPALPAASCSWTVPAELHDPIEQQVIVLKRAANPDAATRFAEFLASDNARNIISSAGYRLP